MSSEAIPPEPVAPVEAHAAKPMEKPVHRYTGPAVKEIRAQFEALGMTATGPERPPVEPVFDSNGRPLTGSAAYYARKTQGVSNGNGQH